MESRRCQGRRQEARPSGPGFRTPQPGSREKGHSLPSLGPALLNAGSVKRKQRKKLTHIPAEVPTGIFRGRIGLSLPDKPVENPLFSTSLRLRLHGKPPRSKYAVLLQLVHLTYGKERSGGTFKT